MFGLNAFGRVGAVVRSAFAAAADPDAVIKALFANNEQGAFYDPSDLTTMFQDRAGTTPVTADGQTVGLILDKSKGLVLGADQVTNGTFSTDTDWTKSTGTTISGGKANLSSVVINTIALEQSGYSLSVGKTYEVRLEISNYSSGSFSIRLGNNGLNNIAGIAANGSYVYRVVPTNVASQSFSIFVSGIAIGTASFDNISVKEIAGNHATAPNDAARPLYKTSGGLHWLQFDGVDDSLSTASFDLSLSTKASLFFGFNKTSDQNPAWLFENIVGNANGISVAQRGTGIEIGFKTGNEMNETVAPYSAQQKLVITALIDTPAAVTQEKIDIRVDGTPIEGSTWNGASAGNFGNFPLNIGKRSDGYYLDFHLNSLIILGRLSTTQEITDTETWVNGKTGAY